MQLSTLFRWNKMVELLSIPPTRLEPSMEQATVMHNAPRFHSLLARQLQVLGEMWELAVLSSTFGRPTNKLTFILAILVQSQATTNARAIPSVDSTVKGTMECVIRTAAA